MGDSAGMHWCVVEKGVRKTFTKEITEPYKDSSRLSLAPPDRIGVCSVVN
jgi:hypothetical protein